MASNISKRLDRLERLANELLTQQEGPVYVRDTDKTEGIDQTRVIVVRREYLAAPERPVRIGGRKFGPVPAVRGSDTKAGSPALLLGSLSGCRCKAEEAVEWKHGQKSLS